MNTGAGLLSLVRWFARLGKNVVRAVWTRLWGDCDDDHRASMGEWFWFTLVIGASPLIIALIRQHLADADVHPILGGDTLLVACIVSSSGVGAIFRAPKGITRSLVAWLGGLGIFLVFIDLICYETVSETFAETPQPHQLLVKVISAILYGASVLQAATSAWFRAAAESRRSVANFTADNGGAIADEMVSGTTVQVTS